MRIFLAVFLWLWAFAAMPAQAPAQGGAQTDAEQTKILALENAWNQAEEHKDVKALESLLDSTVVYIDYDGSMMNKTQFISSVKEPQLHPEQIVNETMTAHVYGDSAVVTGIYHEKGVRNGKAYLHRGRFTDTWVYRGGVWVCVASQSTLISH
ncbi:MAG TPA: nuclear transport factor 2 family protein [Candidatus Sulfotelmatobacter sp.]|nr:nuclear transport factor 2 family protein [Candidatus Sulfotelmatobacter sp.]